jgi:hypothetical protein
MRFSFREGWPVQRCQGKETPNEESWGNMKLLMTRLCVYNVAIATVEDRVCNGRFIIVPPV